MLALRQHLFTFSKSSRDAVVRPCAAPAPLSARRGTKATLCLRFEATTSFNRSLTTATPTNPPKKQNYHRSPSNSGDKAPLDLANLGAESAEVQRLFRSRAFEKVIALWYERYPDQPNRVNFKFASVALQSMRHMGLKEEAVALADHIIRLILRRPHLSDWEIETLVPTISIALAHGTKMSKLEDFISELSNKKISIAAPAFVYLNAIHFKTNDGRIVVTYLRQLCEQYPELLEERRRVSGLFTVFVQGNSTTGVEALIEFMAEHSIEFHADAVKSLLDAAHLDLIPPAQVEPYLATIENTDPNDLSVPLLISLATVSRTHEIGDIQLAAKLWEEHKDILTPKTSPYLLHSLMHELIMNACNTRSIDAAVRYYLQSLRFAVRKSNSDRSPLRALFTHDHPELVKFAANHILSDHEYTDAKDEIHQVPRLDSKTLRRGRALASTVLLLLRRKHFESALVLVPLFTDDLANEKLQCAYVAKVIEIIRGELADLDPKAFEKSSLADMVLDLEDEGYKNELPPDLYGPFYRDLSALLTRIVQLKAKAQAKESL